MGLTTLASYRTRLQTTLGNRGFSDTQLDIWINAGVLELAGAIEFEQLKVTGSVSFADGTQAYTLATDLVKVTAVHIPDEEWTLIKSSVEAIETLRRDFEDIPRFWAVRGENKLVVHPIPDQSYNGEYVYYKEPDTLSASGDTTDLPSAFDNAVYMFAASHAFFDLDEYEKGSFWQNRAAAHAGSRITDAERGAEAEGAPVRVMHRSESQNVSRR